MQNVAAKKVEPVYKTVFIPNKKDGEEREEIYLEIGSHAECRAKLEAEEAQMKAGKSQFSLKDGHFALLHADPRIKNEKARLLGREKKAEPAKAQPKAEPKPQGKAPIADPMADE